MMRHGDKKIPSSSSKKAQHLNYADLVLDENREHGDKKIPSSSSKKAQHLNYADLVLDENRDGLPRPIIGREKETTQYSEILPSSFIPQKKANSDETTSRCPPSSHPHNYMNTTNLPMPKMVYENVNIGAEDKNAQMPEMEVFEVITDHDCLSMSAERLKVRRGDFVQAEKLEAKRALCSLIDQANSLRGWIPTEKLKLVYTISPGIHKEPGLQSGSPPKYNAQDVPAIPPKSPDCVTSPNSSKPKSHDAHLYDDWFVGKMSRTDCEQFFSAQAQERNFVIRESTYRIGDYTVSVQFKGLSRHFPIKLTEKNRYYIGKHEFKNLSHIVNYYRRNPLFHDENQQPVSLGDPLPHKITRTTSC